MTALRRLLATALLLALAGCGEDGAKAPHSGDPLRPFAAATLDGGRIALPADAAGKVVVLRFWATWCGFCKDEMTAIEPVWRQHRDRGLLVLAVNAGQKPEEIAKFVAGLGIGYPVVIDPEARIARDWGVTGLPMTFFIDRQGRVQSRVLGESDTATFRRLVEDLL